MTKTNFNFLSVMLLSSLIVSSYQLPLIENTLNKYGYENDLNEKVSFSKNFQQFVEDEKISFSSYLNGENDATIAKVETKTPAQNDKAQIALIDNKLTDLNNRVAILEKKATVSTTPIEKTTLANQPILKETTDLNQISQSSSNQPNGQNSTNTASAENPTDKSNCLDNCTVLMIGDSVMGDIDFSMQRLIKKDFPTWKVIDGHKVSSGLTNQTYYDWPATAKKLVEKYKPDYVFVLLGTNDAQGMMFNGKGLAFSKDLWVNEYSNRVNQITGIIEANKSSWFWIGLPVTKDKGFNSRLQVIRDIQLQQTKEHYISVEPIFGKNDHSEPVNMKLRANDGIHLNSSGSDLVAKELMTKLKG